MSGAKGAYPASDTKRRIIAAISAQPGVTMDNIAAAVQRRRETVQPYVREMIAAGEVRVEGKPGPKPFQYYLVEQGG